MSSNEYGYIPEVTQSFGDNTGVFDPADINNLVADNKWTQYGQLELIETKTVSEVSSAIFTDIKQDIYNVHFLTTNDVTVTTNGADLYLRFFENGVEETASVYDYAYQVGAANGSFAEEKSTSSTFLKLTKGLGTVDREIGNGYAYFYNLGDSSKYSFQTAHWTQLDSASNYLMGFGSGIMHQASTVDQIKVYPEAGNISATISLYGYKEYS